MASRRNSVLSGRCGRALVLVTAIASLPFGAALQACTVPVFRYALDRWPADPYRLEVSAESGKDPGVAKFLRNMGATMPMNLEPVRLSSKDKTAVSKLIFPRSIESLTTPIWSGSLDASVIATITNSPTRQEIVKRILSGETAVWVLAETGNREVDDATAARVNRRLHFLESAATLPPIDPGDPSSQLGPGPALRVKFSLLRVRQDDPVEAPFVAMLAGPKRLELTRNEPFLAAVFGRGRVLGAWPASKMESEQVDEACLFLLGACSCQAKALNPGWDLLTAIDWDDELRKIGFNPEEAVSHPHLPLPTPETVTITPTEKIMAPIPTEPLSFTARLIGLFGSLLLIAAGGFLWHNAQAKS